jgi:uncharacterized protein (DUF1810 family)
MDKDLKRFIAAQESTFEQALTEIRTGKKTSHWMWYIFPQYKGLGLSSTSKYYSINDLDEAKSYLNHSLLGARLKQLTNELLQLNESDPTQIFGKPDDMKLKSCMTLFATIDTSEDKLFEKALNKFFNGNQDVNTHKLITEN